MIAVRTHNIKTDLAERTMNAALASIVVTLLEKMTNKHVLPSGVSPIIHFCDEPAMAVYMPEDHNWHGMAIVMSADATESDIASAHARVSSVVEMVAATHGCDIASGKVAVCVISNPHLGKVRVVIGIIDAAQKPKGFMDKVKGLFRSSPNPSTPGSTFEA